jgi:hypothetical protein
MIGFEAGKHSLIRKINRYAVQNLQKKGVEDFECFDCVSK